MPISQHTYASSLKSLLFPNNWQSTQFKGTQSCSLEVRLAKIASQVFGKPFTSNASSPALEMLDSFIQVGINNKWITDNDLQKIMRVCLKCGEENIHNDRDLSESAKKIESVIKKHLSQETVQSLSKVDEFVKALNRADLDAAWKMLESRECSSTTFDDKGSSLLHLAAREGRVDLVEKVLNLGVNVNMTDLRKKSALTISAEHGRQGVVDLLLNRGADVNAEDSMHMTPLMWAIRGVSIEHLGCAESLMKHEANINAQDYKGRTVLHHAAKENKFNGIKLLSNNSLDCNKRDNLKRTPLFYAVKYDAIDFVKQLCENGVNLETPNRRGITPLAQATLNRNLEMVKTLVKAGASVNAPEIPTLTPLWNSIALGDHNIVKLLIEQGADPIRLINSGLDLIYGRSSYDKTPERENFNAVLSSIPLFQPLCYENDLRATLSTISEVENSSDVVSNSDFQVIGTIKANRGYTQPAMLAKTLTCFSDFVQNFPHLISNEMINLINGAAQPFLSSYINRTNTFFEQWEKDEPVIIPGRGGNHSLYFLIWQDIFVICDRGNDSTHNVCTFDPAKLTNEMIQQMLISEENQDYYSYIYDELPILLDMKSESFSGKLAMRSLEKQKIGNCSYASAEGIISLMLVVAWYYSSKDESSVDHKTSIDDIVAEQAQIMDNFNAYFILSNLKLYINWILDPTNPFMPDVSLIDTILKIFKDPQRKFDPKITNIYSTISKDWENAKSGIERFVDDGLNKSGKRLSDSNTLPSSPNVDPQLVKRCRMRE